MFAIDPNFEAGSIPLLELALCAVRLQTDARFPWLILIPRVDGARELEDLAASDRTRMLDEAVLAGRAVRAMGAAAGRPVAKLNLGALGNITPQFHLHVVGRRPDDAAWPGAVWGVDGARTYRPADLETAQAAALRVLKGAGS